MKFDGAKAPEPGHAILLTVDGVSVAVFNVGGLLLGVDAKCTHMGGPINQGAVAGTTVTCPWHHSQFDLRTGAVVQGPAVRPLKGYRVSAESTGLRVDPL
ncbi:MAG: Rieske (2Fe-2S) protein [Thermoplasmata archaeon]|nr:Rieske (2Fe-2S) protein [Thermoplasmata archaeon]